MCWSHTCETGLTNSTVERHETQPYLSYFSPLVFQGNSASKWERTRQVPAKGAGRGVNAQNGDN